MKPALSMNSRLRIGLLVVFLVLCLARVASLDWGHFLILDVTDGFFPKEEASVSASAAREVREAQAGLLFFRPEKNAAQLAEALAAIPGIAQAHASAANPEAIRKTLFAQRFPLLFPHWLITKRQAWPENESFSEWLAQKAVTDLDRFLSKPESLGMEDLVTSDTLLLLPSSLEALQGSPTPAQGLIWARLEQNPFLPETQDTVLPLIESVLLDPAYGEVSWTGLLRFASESREKTQAEITQLNVASVLLVLGVVVCFLRRPFSFLHVSVPVISALLGGLALFSLFQSRIHVLPLILASILSGIAVDYGLHLWLHRKQNDHRQLVRALLVASGSSILGFAILAASPNPIGRDTGLLVALGLLSALFAALLYPPFWTSTGACRFHHALTAPTTRLVPRPGLFGVAALLLILGAAGLSQIHWNDDLRILDVPHPELEAENRTVIGNSSGDQEPVLAGGSSFAAAATTLQQADAAGWAEIFPTSNALAQVDQFHTEASAFADDLRSELMHAGYPSTYFDPFFAAFENYMHAVGKEGAGPAAEAACKALAQNFNGPASFLIGSSGNLHWIGTLASSAQTSQEVVALSATTALRSRVATLRQTMLAAGGLGLLLILLILPGVHGCREGLRILTPVVLALTTGVGAIALAQPLNLFHLAGGLLGFCIALDYAVFFRNSRRENGEFPLSIRFSLLTTAAAFSVLLFSSIVAAQSLALTVLAVIMAAQFYIEVMRTAPRHALA